MLTEHGVKSYDGGMSEAPFCESHCMSKDVLSDPILSLHCSPLPTAGLTYAGIGALTFLGRLSKGTKRGKLLAPGSTEFESLVKWLVSRQTSELGEETEEDGDDNEIDQSVYDAKEISLEDRILQLPETKQPEESALRWAGFNGRCNKTADTCYSFWNTGTLAVSVLPSIFIPCADMEKR